MSRRPQVNHGRSNWRTVLLRLIFGSMTIVHTVYLPKPARKKKPAPEIKQHIVMAYSPKRLARIRRL